jgi:hypothetical protein
VTDKTGYPKTGRWTADLPAVDAGQTMEEIGYADAEPAEWRRTPQARTAEEIDPSARLPQMSAQLLRKGRTEPPRSADDCGAVVLARCVERSVRGKA